MKVPSVYEEGYRQAKLMDPVLTDRYAAHLWIGDPLADAVMREVGSLDAHEVARLIGGAIELDDRVLRAAPQSLQELIHEMARVPAWYDRAVAKQGCSAFIRNSDHVLAAFVAGAIVEGFATMTITVRAACPSTWLGARLRAGRSCPSSGRCS